MSPEPSHACQARREPGFSSFLQGNNKKIIRTICILAFLESANLFVGLLGPVISDVVFLG